MHYLPHFLAVISASAALVGCMYLIVASVLVSRFPKNYQSRSAAVFAPVSVMKPLHGDEPGLSNRLHAHFEQHYAGPIQMVCGVSDHTDRAIWHVRQVQNSKQELVDLVIDQSECGPNRKISNLINMLDATQHKFLVISDSDIGVGPNYLGSIMAHLDDEHVGLVTCLYHGASISNVWSQQEALAINSHFLPNVIVALFFKLATPCFGSTIAIRRETLDLIGGFRRFSAHLADDYEIGRAVRQAGYGVAIPNFTVAHHCHSSSLKALFFRELRAARTVRCIDPLGYLGAVITHPFPLALIGALSVGSDSIVLAGIALSLRATLCFSVEHAFGLPRQAYHLIPVNELVSFFAFIGSFLLPNITWRGHTYRVTTCGELKVIQGDTAQPRIWPEQC